MADSLISDLDAAAPENLGTDTVIEAEDDNGDSVAVTIPQLRTALNAGPQVFGGDVDVDGDLTAAGDVAAQRMLIGTDGGQDSFVRLAKRVTGIADNTATTVVTVTIPNATHMALVRLRTTAAMGAGGNIGAGQSTARAFTEWLFARTPGLATVGTQVNITSNNVVSVAGATTTISLSVAAASVSGGNSAEQTIQLQVTISRSGGSASDHVAFVLAEIMNLNATGITIA